MQKITQSGISYLSVQHPAPEPRLSLIFIHGTGRTCGFWEYQTAGLGEAINIVAPDLPGHGKSRRTGRIRISDYTGTYWESLTKRVKDYG